MGDHPTPTKNLEIGRFTFGRVRGNMLYRRVDRNVHDQVIVTSVTNQNA